MRGRKAECSGKAGVKRPRRWWYASPKGAASSNQVTGYVTRGGKRDHKPTWVFPEKPHTTPTRRPVEKHPGQPSVEPPVPATRSGLPLRRELHFPSQGAESFLYFIFQVIPCQTRDEPGLNLSLFFFVFLPFLGPLPWHMDVPRLGV